MRNYYYSDDYAGLEGGIYKFYYGYESKNDDGDWLFVAHEEGAVVAQWRAEEVGMTMRDNPQDVLGHSIAKFMDSRHQ